MILLLETGGKSMDNPILEFYDLLKNIYNLFPDIIKMLILMCFGVFAFFAMIKIFHK